MKLFSLDNIKAIENRTLVENSMTPGDFISAVGSDLCAHIVSKYDKSMPVIIFAGPDICGAYTLKAASMLCRNGYEPHVFLFNIGGNRLGEATATCRDEYLSVAASRSMTEITGMRFTMPELDSGMLIIDGLFGSELTAPLSRGYQILVANINDSGARIISVDTPSGLPADPVPGLINSKIVHATETLTVSMPKLSFFINENIELVGKWSVIGPRPSAASLRLTPSNQFLIEGKNIAKRLVRREYNSSKNDYGSLIIFAGSYGMAGAALLATLSAGRSGCGKVTCHAPGCAYNVIQGGAPSALFDADPDEKIITSIELLRNYSAVAIGPGMGTADRTIDALEDFLKISSANNRPLVLDADALNCIAIRPAMLDHLPLLSVMTPHASEFDRIFGQQPSSSARLAKAVEVARAYKIIIILKGYYTATVRPDGKIFYNSTGTPALATAGTGDVLTGLVGGFMAQGMKPEIASVAAVYIHGLAGRISEESEGSYGVTAEDVARNVGKAIKKTMDYGAED